MPPIEVSMQRQTALVTGASRGIGKEIALELARNGYRVAVNYYNDPSSLVDETVAEIRALQAPEKDNVLPVEADIRSSSQVTAMFDRVIGTFGRLDLLVNNAGVQTWKHLLDVTEEEWDLVVDTNLKGCFLCTQQAARFMKDHGGGSIVNLGSGCNKLAFPSLVAYTASKGGIEMFTKEAAVELGQYGIRVNCIAPGSIESERTRGSRLRGHVVQAHSFGPRRHSRRHCSDGSLSGQQRSIVHQRTDHLDRWCPVYKGPVAL